MRTLIYNPSARVGGAVSILKEVYKDIESKNDSNNDYIFIVGDIDFYETKNITVLKFPWIQKSWIHRVYFDLFVAPKLVQQYKIDNVVSYQNMTIPFIKVPQTLYLQQSLPFVEKKFSFKESKKLWLYQNVICKFVLRSVKSASKIIVQTQWMKKACAEKCGVSLDTIDVQPPNIYFNRIYKYTEMSGRQKKFFYPASGFLYKNHQVIIDACLKLKAKNINDYKVIFTIEGNENKYTSNLKKTCDNNSLNIEFIGQLDREHVYQFYTQSVLLFPSYIETFGLPLLEARLVGSPIIASDSPFSHEVLHDYEEVDYFNAFDSNRLTSLMEKYINN